MSIAGDVPFWSLDWHTTKRGTSSKIVVASVYKRLLAYASEDVAEDVRGNQGNWGGATLVARRSAASELDMDADKEEV